MSRTAFFLLPALVLSMAAGALAADAGKAFLDAATAGPDFAVQGEYVGNVPTDKGDEKVGVQVIALGDGKFHAVAYPGGLPGDGWDKSEKSEVDGQLKDGVAVFHHADKGLTGTIKDGVLTVTTDDGKTIATLKKVIRESPTLGAKPPAGAIVLIDGKSADAFRGGQVEDGLLKEGDTSKQKFQSYRIHLEFRTPFMPFARGQGRGNSGYYSQGRYEVQILDSFGLAGANNECGGIYGVRKPDVNMCYPPLSWQTYDIDYQAAEYKDGKKVKDAELTVRHNGVLVHENVKVPHGTTAHPVPEGPEPGPVYLQNHGNPVRFRNIWVVEKK